MPTFLVTGATGTVGSALVCLLAARGATIRAMSRHPERADLPHGVEPYAGDLDDPNAVDKALAGIQRVFLLTGGPNGPRQDQIMASAAAERALGHLVKLSVLGITEGATDPITQWHREGEDALLRSGVPSSFVRPGAFMSNALNWAPSIAGYASVQAPFGDLPVACVDPIDVAAVAYHLLVHPEPASIGYPVTGPEAISPKEQAAVLADLLGKTVQFTDLSPEQARDQMIQRSMPCPLADAVIASMGSPRLGHGQTPLPTVEQVTGLKPRGFRDWAAAHLAAFATPAANW